MNKFQELYESIVKASSTLNENEGLSIGALANKSAYKAVGELIKFMKDGKLPSGVKFVKMDDKGRGSPQFHAELGDGASAYLYLERTKSYSVSKHNIRSKGDTHSTVSVKVEVRPGPKGEDNRQSNDYLFHIAKKGESNEVAAALTDKANKFAEKLSKIIGLPVDKNMF